MGDMTPTDELRALLDERGIKWKSETNCDTYWRGRDRTFYQFTEYSDGSTTFSTCQLNLTPKQALTTPIAATIGKAMTLDEAIEYAEKFMGDYAKLLLASTLYVEREPTDQHAFDVAERKEGQMARDLGEALATVDVGTCKLVDNDSGPDMHCTACGGGVDDEYRYFMDSWGYSRCPHCGAWIIEEETG